LNKDEQNAEELHNHFKRLADLRQLDLYAGKEEKAQKSGTGSLSSYGDILFNFLHLT